MPRPTQVRRTAGLICERLARGHATAAELAQHLPGHPVPEALDWLRATGVVATAGVRTGSAGVETLHALAGGDPQ